MADKESTIKTIFALDGETKYKEAIKAINAEQKLLNSEMSKAGATYQLTGDKVQYNRDKVDILTRQYDVQKIKVEETRKELEKESQSKDVNAARTQELTKELNYSEAALLRLEKRLKDATKELADQENKVKQAGRALQDFGDKAQAVGGKMTDVGKKMTIGITAPMTLLAKESLEAGIEFESAMAGVRKTTDLTDQEFANMSESVRKLATEIPASTTAIAEVAESAGQLGIQKENIMDFTRVIIDMGNATNLTFEQGATEMARFANITQMSQQDFSRLGSAIVDLGNNYATTESEIMSMSMRLAAAGSQAGMTEGDILGIATALSSLGLEAQAGGSSFSKAITMIQVAVETGSKSVEDFARIAGMSVEEFTRLWKEDAAAALTAFTTGLGNVEEHGQSATVILDELGITELRMSDALKRTAGSQDLMSNAIKLGNEAWAENNALTAEAEQRYATTESQLEVQKNRIKDAAIELGQSLMPVALELAETITDLITKFTDLDEGTQELIIKAALVAAAAGPALGAIGKITTGFGKLTSAVGKAMEGTTGFSGALTSAGKAGLVGAVAIAAIALARHAANLASVRDEVEDLITANEETAKSFEGVMYEIGLNEKTAKDYTSRLFELDKQTEKTAAEQEEMRLIVSKLNDLIPGMNFQIDEQTGALNLNEKAILNNIEAYTNWQKIEANENRIKELENEKRAAQELHDELQQQLDEWENMSPLKAVWEGGVKLGGWDIIGLEKSIEATEQELDKHTKNIEKYQKENKEIIDRGVGDIITGKDAEAEAYEKAHEEIEEDYSEYLENLEKDWEEYAKNYESRYKEHHAELNAISKEGYKESEITADEWLKGMADRYAQQEENNRLIVALSAKVPPEMISHLATLGPEQNKLLNELNNMTAEELAGWVKQYEDNAALATKTAQIKLANSQEGYGQIMRLIAGEIGNQGWAWYEAGAELPPELEKGIRTGEMSVQQAANALAKLIEDSGKGIDGFKYGANYGESLALGMLSKQERVRRAGAGLGSAGTSGTARSMEIYSPSRVGRRFGANYADSIALGMDDEAKVVEKAGRMLGQVAAQPIPTPAELNHQLGAVSQIIAPTSAPVAMSSTTGAAPVQAEAGNSTVINVTVPYGENEDFGRRVGRMIATEIQSAEVSRGG